MFLKIVVQYDLEFDQFYLIKAFLYRWLWVKIYFYEAKEFWRLKKEYSVCGLKIIIKIKEKPLEMV